MEFERLLADFGDATGIDLSPDSQGSAWCEADGVVVTLQHRPEHDDVVIFTLPCGEMSADEAMMRHALELSSAGIGTGGFFIGLYDGYLTLSAVLPLEGLDAETLGKRMLELAGASSKVAKNIGASVADDCAAKLEEDEKSDEDCNQFVFRV